MKSAPSRLLYVAPLLAGAGTLYLGCGDKVVIDASSGVDGGGGGATIDASSGVDSGGGGVTTTTSTTAITAAATTGTGNDCGVLAQAYDEALYHASGCVHCDGIDSCVLGPVFTNACGCPRKINSAAAPDLVALVQEAESNWLGAGCQPVFCGKACYLGTNWACDPGAGGGCEGTCEPY